MNDVKTKSDDIQKLLDEFETKVGLPKLSFTPESPYLEWDKARMQKATNEELYDAMVCLPSYSFNLQRYINKYQSQITWAKSNLKIVMGEESRQYTQWYEDNCNCIIANNEYAKGLHKLIMHSQMVIDRLAYLPAKIDWLTKELNSVLYHRKDYNGEKRSSKESG